MHHAAPAAAVHRARHAAALLPLLVALVLGACGSTDTAAPQATATPSTQWHGILVTPPAPKPAIVLTTTAGQPFDLVAQTRGTVTLLYFGYTHCPDICPQTMAEIAFAVKSLTPVQRAAVRVVFVTTDPGRDTPAALRAWLDHFDRSIVGLVGTPAQLVAAQQAAHVDLATPDPANPKFVDHSAVVFAFTRDDLAHIIYLAGSKTGDFVHDLPILVDDGFKA